MKRQMFFLIILFSLFFSSCSDDPTTSDTSDTNDPNTTSDFTLVATVANLRSSLKTSSPLSEKTEVSVNVTPSTYKLALVNFWLINDADEEINILNTDAENPTYTDASPLIIDFASPGATQELFAASDLPADTYTGYKMQFLYIEMTLPILFHIPPEAVEVISGNLQTEVVETGAAISRKFRLYFNAIEQYEKRDFVVELAADSDQWYWLRRALESPNSLSFFMPIAGATHPSNIGAPDSTIDLFSNEVFWGLEEDYDNPEAPIYVSTTSTVGGLGASLDSNIVIPEDSSAGFTMTLTVDVNETMNFWETDTPHPAGTTFLDNTLDLGPGFGDDQYGDQGLHPFLPHFSALAEENVE